MVKELFRLTRHGNGPAHNGFSDIGKSVNSLSVKLISLRVPLFPHAKAMTPWHKLKGVYMPKTHTLTEEEIKGTTKGTGTVGNYPPRWIRLPKRGHCPETGLTRAAFYQLIQGGRIKTAVLKRPGTVRGQRFVFLPSVLQLLDKAAEVEARRR
ncbi:MAG: hypothetical protein A2283_12405 [Lentisphaerae bacterium RIFOXYA12_FULL_48_11]|nr:MAG: hypothetical protein A2283_12405 [Lentisphaerae bacterium RIFOXYA12_FULL_48_11]